MYDQKINRPRGFGFISFDSEDAIDRVLHKTFHDLNRKQVEVKRTLPKDANPGGGGGGGNYQGYGSSVGNSGSYESRMDSNSVYMQSQSAGGGFFPIMVLLGMTTLDMGMVLEVMELVTMAMVARVVEILGMVVQLVHRIEIQMYQVQVIYGSGPSGAAQSSWNAQPSGYGGAGAYGNAPWGESGGGGPQETAPIGQSPSGGAAAYGYGYGVVGGRIGSGPNSNSTSGVGPAGDIQSGGSYMESGYGGISVYGSSGWRADPSLAFGNSSAQGNGGYGGAPAQQQQEER